MVSPAIWSGSIKISYLIWSGSIKISYLITMKKDCINLFFQKAVMKKGNNENIHQACFALVSPML